jgi:hypothetical protein
MGHDAAGRRASGSRNSIPFFSSDKRRIIAGLGRQAMSALGHKRTFECIRAMSALPPKADIGTQSRNVCFVPKADICSAANLEPTLSYEERLPGLEGCVWYTDWERPKAAGRRQQCV